MRQPEDEQHLADLRKTFERMRRTYWIDQRVPTTLLPFLLPSSASPYWCTLSPNSPIEKKEISNDRTRPMKADQGFYSLAKRAYYPKQTRDWIMIGFPHYLLL